MSIRLDWQQDLEDGGWPERPDGPPDRRGTKRRWGLIVLALLGLAALAAVGWQSTRGKRAAQADLQEALDYAQWALQQQDPALFKQTLDASVPGWPEAVLDDWSELAAAARGAPAPQVESVLLDGTVMAATVRWHDQATGRAFMAWRWFRFTADTGASSGQQDWRWTRPVASNLGAEQVERRAHVTLIHHERDAQVAADVAGQLDALTGRLCERYRVAEAACHFHLRWDLIDPSGRALSWRDLALPPLAEVVSEEINGPIFIQGATVEDWHSSRLRQRLQRFFPGRGFVASSRLAVLRPTGTPRLPDALLGEEKQPIVLPTPWLMGVDDQGRPHPKWSSHAERLLADAVIRRAQGFVLGSSDYVNISWALHQAILAMETGQPITRRLAAPGAAPPVGEGRSAWSELSSLGAALQSGPTPAALAQLDALTQFLQSSWAPDQVAALPAALGSTPFVDRALNQALGVNGEQFLRGWQAGQARRPALPAEEEAMGLAAAGRPIGFAENPKGLPAAAPVEH